MEIRRTSIKCSIALGSLLQVKLVFKSILIRYAAQGLIRSSGAQVFHFVKEVVLVVAVFFLVRDTIVFLASLFGSDFSGEDIRLLTEFLCLHMYYNLRIKLG